MFSDWDEVSTLFWHHQGDLWETDFLFPKRDDEWNIFVTVADPKTRKIFRVCLSLQVYKFYWKQPKSIHNFKGTVPLNIVIIYSPPCHFKTCITFNLWWNKNSKNKLYIFILFFFIYFFCVPQNKQQPTYLEWVSKWRPFFNFRWTIPLNFHIICFKQFWKSFITLQLKISSYIRDYINHNVF